MTPMISTGFFVENNVSTRNGGICREAVAPRALA
jgi:hypothetical protein